MDEQGRIFTNGKSENDLEGVVRTVARHGGQMIAAIEAWPGARRVRETHQ